MKTIGPVLALLLASAVAAQQPPPDPAAGAPQGGVERMQALEGKLKQLREAMSRDMARLKQLPEQDRDTAAEKIYGDYQAAQKAIATEVIAAVKAKPDGDAGLAAARVALQLELEDEQVETVLGALNQHHAASPAIADLLLHLQYLSGSDEVLQKVFATNPAKKAKAYARYVMAQRTEEAAAKDRILEEVGKDFADVELPGSKGQGGEKLGKVAARELYALRNIKVGGTPPDIAGKDMDGAPFKLADYRGKVVVLDFWGFW
jgi:hypothetical protein